MSTQKSPALTLTRNATATISKFLAVTAAGAIASSGGDAIGFATHDAAIGEDFAVDVLGTTTAIAGASLSAGARVQVGSDGKVVAHTTGVSMGVLLFGAASGQPVEIFIDKQPAPYVPPAG